MPRFPVPFGKRRSTLNPDELQNGSVAEPSFRVLDRSEVAAGKSFDAGSRRLSRPLTAMPLQDYPRPEQHQQPTRTMSSEASDEDNMFAGLKPNRYVEARLRLPSSHRG